MEKPSDPEPTLTIIKTTETIDKETFQIIKQNYSDEDNPKEILLDKIKHDYEMKKEGHELFSKWDTNGDGILDEQELQQLQHQFKTTDSSLRYGGLAAAFARALRYTAYVSDVGESFRPIISPKIVNLSYAVSAAYVVGDVAYEGRTSKVILRLHLGIKEYRRKSSNSVIAMTVGERFVFQLVASLLVPAFVIHSCVKVGKKIFTKFQHGRYLRWGPTLFGLSIVPLLPIFVDPPVEYVLEYGKELIIPHHHHAESHPNSAHKSNE